MHNIFIALRLWINSLMARPCAADPLLSMTPQELADLPVSHPLVERGGR